MSDQSIERFLQRVCQAIDEGDFDFWRTSIAEGALVVGSAPEEVYRGREEVVKAFGSYGPIPCQPKAVRGG